MLLRGATYFLDTMPVNLVRWNGQLAVQIPIRLLMLQSLNFQNFGEMLVLLKLMYLMIVNYLGYNNFGG